MSENETATVYANFWMYKVDRDWRRIPESEKRDIREEFIELVSNAHCVTLRGAYSTVGVRHDTDLILWVVTEEFEAMQQLAVNVNHSQLGYYLECGYSYLGIALGSRYTADHAPAFLSGVPPKRYLSVYPFVKTHEWYQLSFDERREAMAEHGRMGREYPDILTNTVSAHGIADHEFVVALECDDIEEMVRMVDHLRRAASRPYTLIDTPIFLGVRKGLEEMLADLG